MGKAHKLSQDMATLIRVLYKDCGYRSGTLARIYNVERSTISYIVRNKSYVDVEYNPTHIPNTLLWKHFNDHIKNHTEYSNMTFDESFKTINKFPHYKLCVDGAVFSDFGFHFTKIHATIDSSGYSIVHLWHNSNKAINKSIHTLLANHFIENPKNLPYTLHKNDLKSNNRLSNLYWGNQVDNRADMTRNGRSNHKIPDFTKCEINKTIELIPNITNLELMKRFGISIQSVRKIRNQYENQQN